MQDSFDFLMSPTAEDTPAYEHFLLEDNGHLFFFKDFLEDNADALFNELKDTLDWRQDNLLIHGRSIPIPRLQAWYGDEHSHYQYSGLTLQPKPFTPGLEAINRQITTAAQLTLKAHEINQVDDLLFNSVLCNLYRDGNDSVAWHSDDEPELGSNPVIASLSLGATRTFQLKHKKKKALRFSIELPHNSLLVMAGTLQHHWHHQIGKTKAVDTARINLTFRRIMKARSR